MTIIEEKLILESEIKLLESFEHTEAYTGELGKLNQKSYILYSDVLKVLNEKKNKLKQLNK